MPKRPPIERVYWTAAIGQMAVARRDGVIGWAEQWGPQRGILLWEDLTSAADWQIGLSGRPTVVVEIGRGDIDPQLLESVREPQLRGLSGGRMWIYPREIPFTRVRWHTYREDLAEPARWYELALPAGPEPAQALPQGWITLDTGPGPP